MGTVKLPLDGTDMMGAILPVYEDPRPVHYLDMDGWSVVVGAQGVKKIEAYRENGELAPVAWFAVWNEHQVMQRISGKSVVAVGYRQEEESPEPGSRKALFIVSKRQEGREWELQGVFFDLQRAATACRNMQHCISEIALNEELPEETFIAPTWWPHQDMKRHGWDTPTDGITVPVQEWSGTSTYRNVGETYRCDCGHEDEVPGLEGPNCPKCKRIIALVKD